MTFSPRALLPGRISGQLALLIVASVVAIHLVLLASFMLSRRGQDFGGPAALHGRIAALTQLIAATAPAERAHLFDNIARTHPNLDFRISPAPIAETMEAGRDFHLDMLARQLGPGFHLIPIERPTPDAERADRPMRIAIRLPDGTVLTAGLPPSPPPPGLRWLWVTALFMLISMTLFGVWAARALTSPLRDLAKAAEAFGLDRDIAALPERGPHEIKTAARALNHMQARIRRLIDDRTRMLAAVGHDLRTPITRLRLRSEFIEDSEVRKQMLRDLDQMQAMIASVLSFLREGRGRKDAAMTDVATLVLTVCDQFSDMGHVVRYEGPAHALMAVHADELQRAVSNLIDNAVRYGTRATATLTLDDAALTIAVEDDGPGICDSDKATMLEPFARGDAARTMDESAGFGLGLAIARAVAEAHGGALSLHDSMPHGLIVKVVLPCRAPSAPSLSLRP